jgi:hypothetical protein
MAGTDNGLTARLGFCGGHAEHLELTRRHHKNIGHVVYGAEIALVNGAKVQTAGPRDAGCQWHAFCAAELSGRSGDHETRTRHARTQQLICVEQRIASLLFAHPANIQHDGGVADAVPVTHGRARGRIGRELFDIDTVVQHFVGNLRDVPIVDGRAPAITRDRQQSVELLQRTAVQGLQPAAHEDVEIVLYDGGADAAHGNGAFGITVKVNQVGPPAPQVRCRPCQEFETPHWTGGQTAHGPQFKAPDLLHEVIFSGCVDSHLVAELHLLQCRFYDSPLARAAEAVQRVNLRGTDVRNLQRPHARPSGI